MLESLFGHDGTYDSVSYSDHILDCTRRSRHREICPIQVYILCHSVVSVIVSGCALVPYPASRVILDFLYNRAS